MINEEEKERFRQNVLPHYQNYVSDVVKAEENFVEVAKEKRLKKINKLKKQMGINIEEINALKKEIKNLNQQNEKLATMIKREENSLYMYCKK